MELMARSVVVTTFSPSGKPKRSVASLQIERRYRTVIRLFLAGEMPNFSHQRHVHVANILWHLPYGRELMHLGLQTMAHRHLIPEKYRADITEREWAKLDGTLPDPALFSDLPGGASGELEPCRQDPTLGQRTPYSDEVRSGETSPDTE